jgi:Ca-activated chloride channel family protein
MRFASPGYLLLLLLLVPLAWWEMRKRTGAVRFPETSFFRARSSRGKVLKAVLLAFNILSMVFVTLALARPQQGRMYEEVQTSGVDIMLCLDISGSMIAGDFAPQNRLVAAKERAKEFISKRKGDRMGLVIFAGVPMTQCPLTLDRKILLDLVKYVDLGMLEDGTAIGMGLATAVARLKDSRAKEKMVILLTDGANNRGELDPVSAARIAQAYGIKVYCIGVGRSEPFTMFVDHPGIGRGYIQLEPADMKTLHEVAGITGAQAFLATDAEGLKLVYDEIDRMEPTTFKVMQHTLYSEKAGTFMLPGLIIALAGILLSVTILRRLP